MDGTPQTTPPRASGPFARMGSFAASSPESPAPSYPFWRVTKVPFPSMDRDAAAAPGAAQPQPQQVFREDARLKFKRIARMLPYGGCTFHIAHSSRVPVDFQPGQVIIGVNKRGLHFFRPKPKKYLQSLALRDILYVRVQGRALFISAEVSDGEQADFEFSCATADQIHAAMAGYLKALEPRGSASPQSSPTIQKLCEPSPAGDDHLQYRSSQAVPISAQEHEQAVAMAAAAGQPDHRRPVVRTLVMGDDEPAQEAPPSAAKRSARAYRSEPLAQFDLKDYEGLSTAELDTALQKEREDYYELKSQLGVCRKLQEQAVHGGDAAEAEKLGREVEQISAKMETKRQKVKVLKSYRRRMTKGEAQRGGGAAPPDEALAEAEKEAAELRVKLAEAQARTLAVEQEKEELGLAMAAFEEERLSYLKDIEKARGAAEEAMRAELSALAAGGKQRQNGEGDDEGERDGEDEDKAPGAAEEEVQFLREELALAMGKAAFLEAQSEATKKLVQEQAAELEVKSAKLELFQEERQDMENLVSECDAVRELYRHEAERARELFNELISLKGKVQVVARVRPVHPELDGEDAAPLLAISGGRTVVQGWKTNRFNMNLSLRFPFDAAFGTDAAQEDIFASAVPLVQSAVDGNNVCLFAFGQSGSGKTYTMFGGGESSPGIVPRSALRLFDKAARDASAGKCVYRVRCSMLELTPGRGIVDLLTVGDGAADEPGSDGLEIKMDPGGFVWVQGAVFLEVSSADELLAAVEYGRSKGDAAGNMFCHTVLSVLIEGKDSVTGETTRGKMTFVDLASPEKAGEALLQDSAAVTKSLSALGDVLASLVSGEQVPAQGSSNRLTSLLSDSLGQDAKALMVVTLSPAAMHAQETHSALQYAARVRGVSQTEQQPGSAARLPARDAGSSLLIGGANAQARSRNRRRSNGSGTAADEPASA